MFYNTDNTFVEHLQNIQLFAGVTKGNGYIMFPQ